MPSLCWLLNYSVPTVQLGTCVILGDRNNTGLPFPIKLGDCFRYVNIPHYFVHTGIYPLPRTVFYCPLSWLIGIIDNRIFHTLYCLWYFFHYAWPTSIFMTRFQQANLCLFVLFKVHVCFNLSISHHFPLRLSIFVPT